MSDAVVNAHIPHSGYFGPLTPTVPRFVLALQRVEALLTLVAADLECQPPDVYQAMHDVRRALALIEVQP